MAWKTSLQFNEERTKNMREVLKENKMSISTLAETTHISRQHLYQVFSGKRGLTKKRVERLYDVLGSDKRIDFMRKYLEGNNDSYSETEETRRICWTHLFDSYCQQLRTYFQTSPLEAKMDIVSGLERLTKDYESHPREK